MSKRKKPSLPPLTFLDRFIYYALFPVILIFSISPIPIVHFARQFLAFSNANILAVSETVGSFLLLIPMLIAFLFCFIPWISGLEDKQPIFGEKGVPYGKKTQNKYPLLVVHKKTKFPDAPRMDPLVKKILFFSLAILALLFYVMGSVAIFSRYELSTTSVIQYNCLNQVTHEYPLGLAKYAKLSAYYSSGYHSKGSYRFTYEIILENGKSVSFYYEDFRDMDSVKQCDAALRGVPKQLVGKNLLGKVRQKYNLSDQDWQTLQSLFDS